MFFIDFDPFLFFLMGFDCFEHDGGRCGWGTVWMGTALNKFDLIGCVFYWAGTAPGGTAWGTAFPNIRTVWSEVSSLVWLFKFSDEALTRIYESEIYDKISRELSWILRHSGWTHADQSLTVFELMAGARFRKLLSVWAHTCHAKEDLAFPAVQKAQLQPWCEASVDRINLLLPLAITIMYNQKGRYQVGILSTSDHQKGERFVSSPGEWIHPAGMTAEDRKELAQLYKQFRAAHVFVQAVSSHSGGAEAPITGLKIPKCQLSDMPDTLVHMTEYRRVRSIQQYGLLCGGGNTAGNKQRNMNHFLPIDGLLVSYEHIRPTANVALVLSKTTLEKHPELMEDFSLSKNGYF